MENYHKINTFCLFILTVIAIAFVLATTKVILIPFTLAIFIALIYSPLIHYFQDKFKLPKSMVLILSLVVFISLGAVIVFLITSSVDSFIQGADQYKDKLNLVTIKLTQTAQSLGFPIEEQTAKNMVSKVPVGKFIQGITGSMLGVLSNTFLVVVFTLFLITGESMSEEKHSVIEEIKTNAGKYIQAKLLTSGATALLSYIALVSFNVEMAFMFAILTFLLNFIPNIGSIIAVVLPLPIILLQFGIGFSFIFLAIALVGIQVVIGNILEPKIMGESMGLHPVTILLFLTFWGFIWGVTGMFLSVPITATLKIIFSKFELTKPISELFSGKLSF
ncbi:MAG: AI-2 transport protein TqsA [Bacteriovoracaceae bacterium]|jgi:AI-2 transport protein TqsA